MRRLSWLNTLLKWKNKEEREEIDGLYREKTLEILFSKSL